MGIYICNNVDLPAYNLGIKIARVPAYSPESVAIKTYVPLYPGNSSDVFGSDICTCKPYPTYAIEECIRGAQEGVGVVVYFRKEGQH